MTDDFEVPAALAAEVEPWLRECGSCDAALPMSCTCPPGDYRNILLKVWRAYEATAAEVKVLTETATKVAYELGRKDALTEIADEMAVEQEYLSYVTFQTDRDTALLLMAAKTPSQAAGAVSDASSGVGGHQEVSEAARSPQEPCGHPDCLCHRHEDQEDA
jgi:hypothetical protein